jgi:hypothetical protein
MGSYAYHDKVTSSAPGRGLTYTFEPGIYRLPPGTSVRIGAEIYTDPKNPFTVRIDTRNQVVSIIPAPKEREVLIEKKK